MRGQKLRENKRAASEIGSDHVTNGYTRGTKDSEEPREISVFIAE